MKNKIYITILLFCISLCGCSKLDESINHSADVKEVQHDEISTEESEDAGEVVAEAEKSSQVESEADSEPVEEIGASEEGNEVVTKEPQPSYIAEDGSIVRMSAEDLNLMENTVLQVIMALPEEKPESTLTQEQLDAATVQWFNTTYAVLMYQNNKDYTLVGGEALNYDYGADMRFVLSRDWGVEDRATAIDNLYWLLTSGHRADYEQTIDEFLYYGILQIPMEEYLEMFRLAAEEQGADFEEIRPYFQTIYQAYQECGDAGIKAWDYCRIMQMCGSYYVAGYFTLEESMDISLVMAQLLQAEYVSWEDMMASYIYGYDYWRGDNPEEQGTGSYWRHYFYDELYNLEESPYIVNDWNLEFIVNWRQSSNTIL